MVAKPLTAVITAAIGLVSASVWAAEGSRVYTSVCMACHSGAVPEAPKLGDKKDWSKRVAEGQAILTAHAYVGLGAMPPKGGRADLSLEEFSAAVVFMVNQSGARWSNPNAAQLKAIRSEIAKREKEIAAAAAARK